MAYADTLKELWITDLLPEGRKLKTLKQVRACCVWHAFFVLRSDNCSLARDDLALIFSPFLSLLSSLSLSLSLPLHPYLTHMHPHVHVHVHLATPEPTTTWWQSLSTAVPPHSVAVVLRASAKEQICSIPHHPKGTCMCMCMYVWLCKNTRLSSILWRCYMIVQGLA